MRLFRGRLAGAGSILFGLACLAVVMAPSAGAALPAFPVTSVRPEVVPRGEAIRIVGRDWPKRSYVSLRIGLPESESFAIGRVRTNGKGRFVKRVRLRGSPGLYIITTCPARCRAPQRTPVRIVGAGGGATTLLHSDLPRSTYRERPGSVGYTAYTNSAAGFESLRLHGLKWRKWGAGQAVAQARARVCTSAGCQTSPARIVAGRRVRYESQEWFYARLAIRLDRDAGLSQRRFSLCTLPPICGGLPTPP